jgi:hypothetical protein
VSEEDDRRKFFPVGGHYDPVSDDEAAAIGRALLSRIRGEKLSPSQEALLLRARSFHAMDARAPAPVPDVEESLIAFERGPDAEIRISWRSYKGSSPFLDLRRFERAHGESEMKPTRQGVTIRARELSRVLTVLVQIVQRLDEEQSEDE